MGFTCPHCSKPYSSEKWYVDHIMRCEKNPSRTEEKKQIQGAKRPRRKSLNSKLRIQVWETYIGQKTHGLCFCCWDTTNPVRPFSYSNTFQAGHIISYANGGKDAIENLLPICRDCNMNMGAENWDDYVARQPHLSLRTYGENPTQKVQWATTIIQSLARMYLERKNPNSHWRIEWQKRNLI